MTRRSGFLFSLDALLAALLLVGGLVLVSSIAQHTSDTAQLSSASQDSLSALSAIGVRESTDPWLTAQVLNGSADGNVTILEQIGYYWATGRTDEARDLAQAYLDATHPDLGVRLLLDDDVIYERNSTKGGADSVVATRMISGIAKGEAITGSSASAHLRYIRDKRNAAFTLLGGFVGEGNISVLLEGIPAGANITDIILELDTERAFSFVINGVPCMTLSPQNGPLSPDSWNLTSCNGLVTPGATNRFGINFTGEVTGAAVAGGYVKVLYTTDEFSEDLGDPHLVYRFPGINGLINLYDGIFIDGNVTEMNVTLSFLSEYQSYLTIGNASFTFPGSNLTQNITLTDAQVQAALSAAGLNYAYLSRQTIPMRFGIGEVQINGAPADVVVVTDTSGSMDWCITNDLDSPCPPGDTTKIIAARNVTKAFVTSLLNTTVSGTRVGLAEFSTGMKSWHNLTTNLTELLTQINGYTPTSSTCICCGINNATNSLNLEGQAILIPRGSAGWKYNDTDLGSPPAGWNTSGYDDSGWKSGTTPIGWTYSTINTIIANKYEGDYYHRRKFNVTDANDILDARLYVYSDDGADVYLNGARIDNDYGSVHNAVYWNRNGRWVNKSRFVTGENVIAVRQWHRQGSTNRMGFDLQLVANTVGNVTGTQTKNIVVMSDGEANVECSQQNTGDATQDAIKAACDAYSLYGIVVYAVGFGLGADVAAMTQMANCTTGEYFSANDSISLEEAFESIAGTIIASSSTQTAIIAGNVSPTILYGDSAIRASYVPIAVPPQPNEISLTLQTPPFPNCNGTAELYPGMRFVQGTATSYSGEYWTDKALFNGNTIYNLTRYSTTYASLGDPYRLRVPSTLMTAGNNTVAVTLGIDGLNSSSNCSTNNTLIYTVAINLSTERSEVVEDAEGCSWAITFEDGTSANLTIPVSYTGGNDCSYRPGNITYDPEDAYQLGAYKLFRRLDFRGDGTVFVNLRDADLEIIVTTISGVPYMWGPAIARLEVTR